MENGLLRWIPVLFIHPSNKRRLVSVFARFNRSHQLPPFLLLPISLEICGCEDNPANLWNRGSIYTYIRLPKISDRKAVAKEIGFDSKLNALGSSQSRPILAVDKNFSRHRITQLQAHKHEPFTESCLTSRTCCLLWRISFVEIFDWPIS